MSSRLGRTGPTSRTPLTLRIEDVAPGGQGVAHTELAGEGRAVFVPRTAAGDVVRALVDTAVRPARGRVVTLVTPGPGRVVPPCVHVETCGACDWMHLSLETQTKTREDHVRRALPHGFRAVPVRMHEAGAALGYRTRARFHVRASGGRAIVGPHGLGTNDIVDVGTCIVLHPALDACLAPLARVLEGAHGQGEASLALGSGGKPVVELRWQGKIGASSFGRLEEGVQRGVWAGGSIFAGDVVRPAVVGDPAPSVPGADGQPLRLAPGGFAQASDAVNLAMARRVLALAQEAMCLARGPGKAKDASGGELYAGAGNFTVLLAGKEGFGKVLALEFNGAACEAARENLTARGLTAKVTCADADRFVVPPKTDLVVMDPPRGGAKKACLALAASKVGAIVYVSCDPPTLGRDLTALADRYEAVAIESFAMFPGTSHAETVVALVRKDLLTKRRAGSGAAS